MKKSLSVYCYVEKVEKVSGEDFVIIHLQNVDTYDRILFQTRDLELAETLERGDRFEVQLKFKPRKSGVTHLDEVL